MASIGRIVLSAASGMQDATLALSNINFDFSLIKFEAPVEYRELGALLSSSRKRDAEEGPTHATARKLGALFADDLPHVPHLVSAYGRRVSEISRNPKFNPQGGDSDGPFADHVGADGTSIWAAATSGKGALEAHLLACILARTWPVGQAISIWYELIAARKAVLQKRTLESSFHISSVTAAQIEISREQLAAWDSSARSWLRTADAAKRLQQTQLMLILDNVKLRVQMGPMLYESVMIVWTKALTVIDKLTSGIAQSVENADNIGVLIGLSAWHLYPDMHVLAQQDQTIYQKDEFVKRGGLLTLGLQGAPRDTQSTGISWSMPLKTLRYYGPPVESKHQIDQSSSRVTFDRFLKITFGSVISNWKNNTSDLAEVMESVVVYAQLLGEDAKCDSQGRPNRTWLHILCEQAQEYQNATDLGKLEIARYVALGRRRFGKFLAEGARHPAPCFGLGDPAVLIDLLDPRTRVNKLREFVKRFDRVSGLQRAIIRYRSDPLGIYAYNPTTEFAALLPQCDLETGQEVYRRWIPMHISRVESKLIYEKHKYSNLRAMYGTDILNASDPWTADIKRSIQIMAECGEPCGFYSFDAIIPRTDSDFDKFTWLTDGRTVSVDRMEAWTQCEEQMNSNSDFGLSSNQRLAGWRMGNSSNPFAGQTYRFLFGSNEAAVFVPELEWKSIDFTLPLDLILRELKSPDLLPKRLSEYNYVYRAHPTTPTADYFHSLNALETATHIYSELPDGEIDLSVLKKPLHTTKWAQSTLLVPEYSYRREQALACVALFDTGVVDLEPGDFQNVLAISSMNTIYASESLFHDPYHPAAAGRLRRVIGSVGKPGLSLLISPQDTFSREPEIESWELVNHVQFDGSSVDSFKSTSLHLSLTGYEMPLNVGDHGTRDKEAFYLEAIVSAHDRGAWVADVDLLSLSQEFISHKFGVHGEFKKSNFRYRDSPCLADQCAHSSTEKGDTSGWPGITAIDNWHEYLDLPTNTAVVRAKGNWTARLALAAVAIAKKKRFVLAKDEICWACVEQFVQAIKIEMDELIIIC